jgi:hypothetical protein
MPQKRTTPAAGEIRALVAPMQQIANCLGYLVIKNEQFKDLSDNDLIPVLWRLGFGRNDIAAILDTTPGTVSVRISRLKAEAEASKLHKGKSKKQTGATAGSAEEE